MALVVGATRVGSAFSRTRRRALFISSARCFLVIARVSTTTSSTPGRALTLRAVSFSIWDRIGHSAMVRANPTVTVPPSIDISRTMPRSTTSDPSSGSNTPRRDSTIRSSVSISA